MGNRMTSSNPNCRSAESLKSKIDDDDIQVLFTKMLYPLLQLRFDTILKNLTSISCSLLSGYSLYYSHWGPPSTNAPYSYETCVFKFPRICGSSGGPVVHNVYKFSINRPVLSCLFLSSLKRTQDIRLSPQSPPRSDGSRLYLSSRSFPPPGSPFPITYLNLARLVRFGSR